MLRVEVVGEESVVAAYGRGLRAAPQRQRGEEESGRPAFEPLREGGRLLAGEQHPGPPEQGLRFAILERELVHPDLEQAALRPQAGKGQRRRAARRERNARPVRGLTEQPLEGGERCRRAEDVHVVDQRENARARLRLQRVAIRGSRHRRPLARGRSTEPDAGRARPIGPAASSCRTLPARRS